MVLAAATRIAQLPLPPGLHHGLRDGRQHVIEHAARTELHFGRDWFAGAMLRFNDEDLAALLTVGGSALAGAGR